MKQDEKRRIADDLRRKGFFNEESEKTLYEELIEDELEETEEIVNKINKMRDNNGLPPLILAV